MTMSNEEMLDKIKCTVKANAPDAKVVLYGSPLYDLGCESDASISVNLYTANDWQRRSFTLFYKNVETEGIVL
jgi:DNA polymerase sigma